MPEDRVGVDASADLSRMVMLWPTELKEQVRQLVGLRGTTKFVIAAVREKLGNAARASVPVTAPEIASPITLGQVFAEGEADSDACPNCHAPLVDGACWLCE